MSKTTARTYWKGQGKNFMTPEAIAYHDLPNGLLVEVSRGYGFDNEPILGVSVASLTPTSKVEPRHELSTMFHSEEEVERYVALLGHIQLAWIIFPKRMEDEE